MIRILLVDDHALFREGLARLLNVRPDLQVSGQCSTVQEALALMRGGGYDLLLLDYELGDRRGNEIVIAAKERKFAGKILVVTVGVTRAELRQLLNHGASGVFLKNNPPETLVEAIHAVMRGETWIDPKYTSSPAEGGALDSARRARFTERDRIVLRGVFEGLANKEIAERIGVSESAIKASLQQLFSKTGVRTRSQLVRVALEQYRRELL
ncbi:MAG: response regulator transcription factor [Acidobacteria bacterium]|nr:response regulator transcription factor [Acidobacteriota bacterium]